MPLVGYLKKNNFWKVLKLAVHAWFRDNIITHSAALAYYTIFAMVPLTLVIIAVSSFFLEADVSRGEIHRTMTMMIGAEGADALNAFVQNSTFESPGLLTSIIGFVSLLFGATSMFSQLQDSLNYIWQVKPKPHAKVVYSFFQQRAISFSLVIFVGVLLLLSLILSTLLASFGKLFHFYLPGGSILWQGVEWVLFFFLSILLFAVIYKVFPDIDLTWENVWSGAVVTAILFNLGKVLISYYIANSAFQTTYGTAGSIIVILVWTYYSSAVLFLGAEFTHYYYLAQRKI